MAETMPPASDKKKQAHRCGGCESRWSGAVIAHCSTCHRTFTSPSGFDRHRSRKYDDSSGKRVMVRDYGQCYDPADDGMVQNDRGQWGMPNDGYDFRTRTSAGSA
jgi:hypothetical protein